MMLSTDKISLEQTDAVENIAKSSLIAFCILIKLAVVRAHLHLLSDNLPTLSLGSRNVLLQGATATEIRNLRL